MQTIKALRAAISFLAYVTSVLLGPLPVAAHSVTKLNQPLVKGGDVVDHHVSRDRTKVAYVADQQTNELFELFLVDLSANNSVSKLSPNAVEGGDVIEVLDFAGDGSRIVYFADHDEDEVFEIYSVLADGSSPPVKLNGTMVSRGDVRRSTTRLSPDSTRVFYIADQEVDERYELFSRLIDGSEEPVKLNAPLFEGEEVLGYLVSPDSSRVVFRVGSAGDRVGQLFSQRADGSEKAISVAGTGAQYSPLASKYYKFSPNSERIVFLGTSKSPDIYELYSALVDGAGSLVRVNEPVLGNYSGGIFEITPDSTQVVYAAEQDSPYKREVYVRSIDGIGDSIKLNAELTVDQASSVDDLSGDGMEVVYLAKDESSPLAKAHIVPIDLSRPPEVIGQTDIGPIIGGFLTCPKRGHYVYYLVSGYGDYGDLYSSRRDGTRSDVHLSTPAFDGRVRSTLVSRDGKYLIYRETTPTYEGGILHAVPIIGGYPAPINLPLTQGGGVRSGFQLAADDRSVIYRAEQDSFEVIELYMSRFNIFDSGFERAEQCWN